jgi:hypothetical protein
MTASHRKDLSPLVRPLFDAPPPTNGLASRFQSALGHGSSAPAAPAQTQENVHAFTILSKILADDRLIGKHVSEDIMIKNVMETQSKFILEHAMEWTLNASDPLDVERKLEELQWMVTIMYAAPHQDRFLFVSHYFWAI